MFVTELLFALPLLLTLQAFVADEPLGTRSHQFTRFTSRNVYSEASSASICA